MTTLGVWIVDTAFEQFECWCEATKKDLSLSINLSPLQIIDAVFIEHLEQATIRTRINPARITLDISNEVVMGSTASAKEALKSLHRYGFDLSLNDFGGGDINLYHILDCGFNGLKLSRELIAKITDDPKSMALIRTVLAIADVTQLSVTAVGIETKEQATVMQELGITKMQGYLYNRPVPAEQLDIHKKY